jgi:hypothetical protein
VVSFALQLLYPRGRRLPTYPLDRAPERCGRETKFAPVSVIRKRNVKLKL